MELLAKDAGILGMDEVLKQIKVVSPYGLQIKRELKPFKPAEREALGEALDRLEIFVKAMKRQPDVFSSLRSRLSHLKEISESLSNASQDMALSQVELFEVKGVILLIKAVASQYGAFLKQLPDNFHMQVPEETDRALDPTGEGMESFYLSDSYSEQLAAVREKLKETEKTLKVYRQNVILGVMADYGALRFRPNGVAIIAKSDRRLYEQLRGDLRLMVVDEHYETVSFGVVANSEMEVVIREIEALKWEEEQETYTVRLKLSQIIASELNRFRWSLNALGELDLYVAKAALAIGVNGVKPELVGTGEGIHIEEGRHIGVEIRLRREQKGYTPVTVRFDTPVSLITGANMGGKTIALKMIGLCVAMAHYGLYVPAVQLKTPILDFLIAVIGDEQSIDKGLSTFGSEVVALIKALDQGDREGLILIDELARGTNPAEGAALSKSIVEYMSSKAAYSVITTHYDGIAAPDNHQVRRWQVKGLKQLSDIASLAAQMDYRLEPVECCETVPHDALRIAELLGLPKVIVDRAYIFLHHEEAKSAE